MTRPEATMRLHFEMTGGYSGIFAAKPLVCDVADSDLAEAERGELRERVAASGLLEAEPAAFATTPRADVLAYRLIITHAGTTRTFVFDDTNAPGSARPLLEHFQKRALDARARRAPNPGLESP